MRPGACACVRAQSARARAPLAQQPAGATVQVLALLRNSTAEIASSSGAFTCVAAAALAAAQQAFPGHSVKVRFSTNLR